MFDHPPLYIHPTKNATLRKPKPITDQLPVFYVYPNCSFQTKCKQGIVDPMLSIWGQQLIVHEDTNQ